VELYSQTIEGAASTDERDVCTVFESAFLDQDLTRGPDLLRDCSKSKHCASCASECSEARYLHVVQKIEATDRPLKHLHLRA
jgi:hypothetical protein